LRIEKVDCGRSGGDANDIGAPLREDHGVGGLGIAHQHAPDVARKIVDKRLAFAD
jgi:hypothetical protein